MGAHFKVDGREYPLPDFDTIDFDEARAIKAATGLRMGELMPAFNAGDADAMLALFIVAKLRVDGEADPVRLGKIRIVDLGLEDDEPVEAADGPLASAAPKQSKRPRSVTPN